MRSFYAYVSRGNNLGISFIRIPQESRKNYAEKETVKITLDNKLSFYSKIRKNRNGIGVYIPKETNPENNLYGKKVEVLVDKVQGFHSVLGKDGRLYIPQNVEETFCLNNGDIILIRCLSDPNKEDKFCKVHVRLKKNKECMCIYDCQSPKFEGLFEVVRKVESIPPANKLFEGFSIADNDGDVTLFDGQKRCVETKNSLTPLDFSHYLGCYFADGTRKGNSWGISASSFKQALYFAEMHKKIISKPNLDFCISYTSKNDLMGNEKEVVIEKWFKETGIRASRARIRVSNCKNLGKLNPSGTMVLLEHRKLTQTLYNRMLDNLQRHIIENNDEKKAIEFICGVMEGDGSPSARKRGHIVIATNTNDAVVLEKIISVAKLNHRLYSEGPNRVFVRITSMGLLEKFDKLYNLIFIHYPKRRQRFAERFLETGAARFIIKPEGRTSNFLKSRLKEKGLLDENCFLTPKGEVIRSCLLKMAQEMRS